MNNAIQAMAAGGKLTLETQLSGEGEARRVAIAVADSGCGIPPERIESIFSDFVTTKRHGLGLGLAIVKRIFDQHGAEVQVESEVGRGTVFLISLPVRIAEGI